MIGGGWNKDVLGGKKINNPGGGGRGGRLFRTREYDLRQK